MASYTISIEGGESFDCADDVYCWMLPRLLVSICHRRVGPVLAQLVLEKFSQVLWIKSIKVSR